jgi:hypothetical protein
VIWAPGLPRENIREVIRSRILLFLLAAAPSACCTGGAFAPPPGLTHETFQATQLRSPTAPGVPPPATANHAVTITPVITQRIGKKPKTVRRMIRPPRTLGAIEAHEVTGAAGEKTLLLGPANKSAPDPSATATPIEAVVVPE